MFASYEPEWEKAPLRVYDANGQFAGIYEFKKETRDYKPLKVFMEL